MSEHIAVDLGASNGRTILGRFDGNKLVLEELNRFENNYIISGGAYYWNILSLYANILEGIQAFNKKSTGTLSGIGIDTWGVDYGLIDRQGRLIGNPRAYRDPRGQRGMKAFHAKYGERKLFDITGIANLEFNTAYQLYDMVTTQDPQLEIADKLLMLPDLLGYLLCGDVSCEFTNATTTQMLSSQTGKWSDQVVQMLGIPASLLPAVRMSGESKGVLLRDVAQLTGLGTQPPVISVGSHDTASAVASVPASTDNYAFISSGTWSLMGVMSGKAIINDTVYQHKLSNEGTVNGGYRPLRNIMGLWVIQNCKRHWNHEEKLTWDEIADMAREAPAFNSFIDVNAGDFFTGENMPQKIQKYCADTGQNVPQTKGEIARTVYESLAMSYRETFMGLEQLKGERISVLHIVGGGSKDVLLNEFTASAIDREVIAGPSEATAIGNLMMQLKATGEVTDMTQMRDVISHSFSVKSYTPVRNDIWAEQYERYISIKKQREVNA